MLLGPVANDKDETDLDANRLWSIWGVVSKTFGIPSPRRSTSKSTTHEKVMPQDAVLHSYCTNQGPSRMGRFNATFPAFSLFLFASFPPFPLSFLPPFWNRTLTPWLSLWCGKSRRQRGWKIGFGPMMPNSTSSDDFPSPFSLCPNFHPIFPLLFLLHGRIPAAHELDDQSAENAETPRWGYISLQCIMLVHSRWDKQADLGPANYLGRLICVCLHLVAKRSQPIFLYPVRQLMYQSNRNVTRHR